MQKLYTCTPTFVALALIVTYSLLPLLYTQRLELLGIRQLSNFRNRLYNVLVHITLRTVRLTWQCVGRPHNSSIAWS